MSAPANSTWSEVCCAAIGSARIAAKKRAGLGDHWALTSQCTPGRRRARLASQPEGLYLQLLQETYMTLSSRVSATVCCYDSSRRRSRPAPPKIERNDIAAR